MTNSPLVSVYRNSYDTNGAIVSIEDIAHRLISGARGLDEKTRYCNITAQTDPPAYKAYKERELPAVTFSGTFPKGKRKAVHLATHSGFIILDIDGLTESQMPEVRAELLQMPQVFLAFVSPSGLGIKVILRVDPIPRNDLEHKGAYQACLDFFENLAEEYGFEIDTSGKDCSRLCYLAHDRLAILHTDAPAISWDREAWLTAENEKQKQFQEAAKKPFTGTADINALDFIDPNDLDYNQWLSVLTACKVAKLTWQQADAWSRRGGVRYQEGEVETRWHGLNLDVSWGAVVNLAKRNGYTPPRLVRRSVKLHKNVVSMLTETIDKSREFLKSVFDDKKIKFFGLRADTGVGKTEGFIAFLMRGFSGLITVPTTDLAKELEVRFDDAEVDGVFRYRGILSNPDGQFPDDNPCIHAVRYDAIASRGWNAYELLCEPCEVRDVCEERGYRSQAEKAKQAQVTVMPFPQVFLNPAFRTVAKDYVPTYHDDLILHDEFDPTDFIQMDVPKSRRVQLRDDWAGYDPSMFAKEMLRILEVEADLSQLRSLVTELTDAERESILEGFTKIMWNGQILSREDAHRCDEFRIEAQSLDTIGNLPRLETDDWNLIVQLELFFQRYPRDADMPMKYENDTLTFYLPPMPMKTRARMGFMSATLDETAFRRAMDSRQIKRGDVTFHDTGLTEWHPEAKVYQLRTNRNPRATVFAPKTQQASAGEGERRVGAGGWNASETERQTMPAGSEGLLSPTGEYYWGLVAEDLKKPKRGLITYKALLEAKASELEGLPTANFGGLVGLDTHFKDVEVLHILFSPELPPSAVEFKAKMLYGNDTEPLCYDRDENGHYIDARLQACYDDGVIAELQQAIGRGRLVSRPVIIVVWCSHHLPGITDRAQCLLFDETDWQQAEGDIEKLQGVVAEREKAETTGDTHAYAEATGVSERTAYRQTAEFKKQNKAERNTDIKRRHAKGETQQAIANALEINKATVNRVLKT